MLSFPAQSMESHKTESGERASIHCKGKGEGAALVQSGEQRANGRELFIEFN